MIVLGDEARRIAFSRAAFGRQHHPAEWHSLSGDRHSEARSVTAITTPSTCGCLSRSTPCSRYFPPLNVGELTMPISFINYQPRTRDLHETAKLEVHKVIARNHGFDYRNPDAFDEWDTIRTADQVGKIFDAMNVFLGSVGLVTLALGAIGIINIMLVAVADRTREIGLRKAIGATNGSIMFQFFVEGAFLTLLSGGIGMAFAAGLMAALGMLPSPPGFDPPKLVPSTAAAGDRGRSQLLASPPVFIPRGERPCCNQWRRCARNSNASRPPPTSLRRHAPRSPQDASHHAGHGVGHRHGCAPARLWGRLRARDQQHL